MAAPTNHYKLGLFVILGIAATIAVAIGLGAQSMRKETVTYHTYFNESVQGLDVGSKMKYRGVTIGEVTRISFTYVKYEQDKPMNQRKRYVLVEAQIEPRLVGGKAANDITSPESSKLEVERGLRIHLAPQGITGTNYLELDYVEPPAAPMLPIDWVPDNIYIPSTPSTVTTFVNAASDILDRLRNLDLESTIANMNRLLQTTNERVSGLDTAKITEHADRTLSKLDATLDGLQSRKVANEAVSLIAELRQTNQELKSFLANPALAKLPQDTSATLAGVRELVGNPALPQSIAHLERTLARLDRIFGAGEADLGTTFANLRQITDNLRDLTEDAKRYPSNVLFGAPPRPLEPAK